MAVFRDRKVAWVGVVMVHDDGSVYAVEMDGARQRIAWQVNTEYEYDREMTEPIEQRVEVRVTGVGRPWRDGRRFVRREPMGSIAVDPRLQMTAPLREIEP